MTVAATSSQLYAEALSGMAFAQLVRPGAPVIFGTFSSSMSMQSGAPTFGTPEPQQVLYIVGAWPDASECLSAAAGGYALLKFQMPRQLTKRPIPCSMQCWQE